MDLVNLMRVLVFELAALLTMKIQNLWGMIPFASLFFLGFESSIGSYIVFFYPLISRGLRG